MKIIHDNLAYIQKGDLRVIFNFSNLVIPNSLVKKAFSEYNMVDRNNKDEFILIVDKEEIDFLKTVDFVIDFTEVKNKSIEELNILKNNIINDYSKVLSIFNSLDENGKNKNISLYLKLNLFEYKIYSIEKVIQYKQGKIKLNLPKGEELKEKKTKTLLNRLFHKQN